MRPIESRPHRSGGPQAERFLAARPFLDVDPPGIGPTAHAARRRPRRIIQFPRAAPAGVIVVSLLAACRSNVDDPPCPSCANARLRNQWCDHCNLGHVASVRIKSRVLFDCLDAHGHPSDPANIQCPDCRAAMKNNGFCESCKCGWIGNSAYFSRLTHALGLAQALDPEAITCPDCHAHAKKYGWCPRCNLGMIGNFAIRDRAAFDAGCRGYDLMLRAISESSRCEACAMAVMTDTECPFCRITFQDGVPLSTRQVSGPPQVTN